MKLSNAAKLGNTQVASDAYGSATFKCQYEPMSFAKIDGVSVRKRQISTSPDVTVPARGAIAINGDIYLVGHGAPDFFKNEVIRVSYIIQGADGLANLTSIATALANAAPVVAYAALVFSKYLPDSADSSKYPPQYQMFLAGSESAPADSLIQLAGKWYLAKESYVSTSGLRIALVNEIAEPAFETINYSGRTYVPATDSFSVGTSVVKILRIKWQEHFLYLSKGSETYERGDQQIFILKATTPKPSDTLTLSDGVWRVLAVQDDGAVWSCHVRRG
jgi:hypothetical protein